MAERVTITIEPSDDHGGQLTVRDAMRQVLDFIEVVTAAAGDDARLKFEWRLLSATTNSPFTAVAEAISVDPDWPDIDAAAKFAKSRTSQALKEVYETGSLPEWAGEDGRRHIKNLLRRNLNGVARTEMRFEDDAPPVVLVERRARAAIEKIELSAKAAEAARPDFSGEEFGSLDAFVLDATTHYGRPALRIRERISDAKIICVLTPELAERIGRDHSWHEVWKGQRVLVTGKLKRQADGVIVHIMAEDIRDLSPTPVALSNIADSNFTGGKGARDYLEDGWD